MAIDLAETNIDHTLPKFRSFLENLQANILKSHGREEADHILFRFSTGPDEAKEWIQEFSRRNVTSARQQLDETDRLRRDKTHGGLVASLYLTATGYRACRFDDGKFQDPGRSFRNGMKHRAFSLFARNRDPLARDWEVPYRGEVHAMVAVADDSAEVVATKTQEVLEDLAQVAEVLTVERGTVLRNARGETIEPFGYVDGVSQPLFLKQDFDVQKNGDGIDVLDPSAPLNLVLVEDPFSDEEDSFGSYLVFRKLRQDVVGFNNEVEELATRLSTGQALAGALAVGRFKDGTPVTLQQTDGLGALNDFSYQADPVGNRCPFHGHIRKANQRGDNRALTLEEERSRRIVRRGIPYGSRGPAGSNGDPPQRDGDVGLLFACFQSDIRRQFEFIQRSWVDNPNFPEFLLIPGLNTGDDSLIGQHPRGVQKWPQTWGQGGRIFGRRRFNFGGHVTLEGGGYFFAPSLSFLRNLS